MKWQLRFGRSPRIASTVGLADFLAAECAYLAQKTATDYCQAKAGFNWQKLFSEPNFQAALNICRWEGFIAILADAVLVAEGRLRAASAEPAPLADAMGRLHAAVLERHPAPEHLPQGWGGEINAFRPRLARAQLAAPAAVEAIARVGAKRLFDALPIHPHLRRHDHEMIENAVRFGMVAFSVKLDERLDVEATARELQALG